MPKLKIVCVCLGNICRSPMAEGVLRATFQQQQLIEGKDFLLDSAGTGSWHIGSAPDIRAQTVCRNNGLDISGQRARQLAPEDGEQFDLILAMDKQNVLDIQAMIPPAYHPKVQLFCAPDGVTDPYLGEISHFVHAFDMLKQNAHRWLPKC